MSKIEWTDETWNPVIGCSRVSAGCINCYAERMALTRLSKMNNSTGERYRKVVGPKGWNGKLALDTDALTKPLKWRKPRKVFVNSMSDLFHESLSNEGIALVFSTMSAAPQHVFQVLTKRSKRMADWFAWIKDNMAAMPLYWPTVPWPLPNVHIGVSVENAKAARQRIGHLVDIPAAVKFLSCEPLVGPLEGGIADFSNPETFARLVHWVIVGGESGPDARRMRPEWARLIRDACIKTGTPFFFKQWGEFNVNGERVGKFRAGRELDGQTWDQFPEIQDQQNT